MIASRNARHTAHSSSPPPPALRYGSVKGRGCNSRSQTRRESCMRPTSLQLTAALARTQKPGGAQAYNYPSKLVVVLPASFFSGICFPSPSCSVVLSSSSALPPFLAERACWRVFLPSLPKEEGQSGEVTQEAPSLKKKKAGPYQWLTSRGRR